MDQPAPDHRRYLADRSDLGAPSPPAPHPHPGDRSRQWDRPARGLRRHPEAQSVPEHRSPHGPRRHPEAPLRQPRRRRLAGRSDPARRIRRAGRYPLQVQWLRLLRSNPAPHYWRVDQLRLADRSAQCRPPPLLVRAPRRRPRRRLPRSVRARQPDPAPHRSPSVPSDRLDRRPPPRLPAHEDRSDQRRPPPREVRSVQHLPAVLAHRPRLARRSRRADRRLRPVPRVRSVPSGPNLPATRCPPTARSLHPVPSFPVYPVCWAAARAAERDGVGGPPKREGRRRSASSVGARKPPTSHRRCGRSRRRSEPERSTCTRSRSDGLAPRSIRPEPALDRLRPTPPARRLRWLDHEAPRASAPRMPSSASDYRNADRPSR